MILGIDEVGRGPWAGPLVVGAVVLGGETIDGLADSKKLSKKRREELDILIREHAAGFGLGWVSAEEVDEIGLSEALVRATKRAVEQVKVSYHEIIIDGTINFLDGTNKGSYVTTMKKADQLVPSVSAASIIAKVARDTYMEEQSKLYPGYGFEDHVGYGTAKHRAAIERHGVTPLHRLSFKPLHSYAKNLTISQSTPRKGPTFAKTTKQIGDSGEDAACEYLKKAGHTIVERNWKTKFCEIDIVSRYEETLYFSEVKYRTSDQQGGGFGAITPKKERQMRFAAEFYALTIKNKTLQLRLAAISVSGIPPTVEQLLEVV
jgi:ribonuclease HII